MKHGNVNELADLPVSHDPEIKKRVLLQNGDVPHVTQVARHVFLPQQVARSHSHTDMYELFVCLSGQGVAVVNGAPYVLTPGAFVLIEPNDAHEIKNDGSEHLVLAQLGVAE